VRTALFGGIVFVAGCSLLVPLDASSGGAEEGTDAAVDADGAAASNDANTTTSSSSGGSSGTPGDAASDAAPFVLKCPPGALLCDDFERNDVVAANGWKAVGLAISSQLAYSPTRSLAIFDPTGDYRAIEHAFEAPPLHLKVTFRLHAGAAPPGLVEVLKVPFGPLYAWDTATLSLDAEGLYAAMQRYDGDAGPAVNNVAHAATAGTIYGAGFRSIVWSIDLRNDEKHASVSVDNGPVVDCALAGHSPSVGPASLLIGTLYRNADGPVVDTYIDDVVVEAVN
jgi:hypothetical protein